MSATIDLMLKLLHCSLNNRQPDFLPISEQEWTDVFWLARKHGVVTMINDVIEALPTKLQPHSDIALSWSLSAERTHYHFDRQAEVLEKIRHKSEEAGLQLVLLKGMTLAKLYPHPNSRACGDIDIFFPGNYMKGNALLGNAEATLDGKHSEMAIDGVTVENHLYLLDQNYRSQRKAEKYIQQHATEASAESELPPLANMVYLLMHTVSHLTAKDKLPLRNLLDWGIFLKARQAELNPQECHQLVHKIGMEDAFNILTQLASEFTDTDLSRYIIGKLRAEDVNKMRAMVLNKDYRPPMPKGLSPIAKIRLRITRNRTNRWLYRYLPSNSAERMLYRIKPCST